MNKLCDNCKNEEICKFIPDMEIIAKGVDQIVFPQNNAPITVGISCKKYDNKNPISLR
jgi:hypothetical protein